MSVYRVGRKVGRTIYLQQGDEPSDHDILVGMMDTPWLAKLFINSVNCSMPTQEVKALEDCREELRTMMLKQPTTSTRETYSDGFQAGLAHSIGCIDKVFQVIHAIAVAPESKWRMTNHPGDCKERDKHRHWLDLEGGEWTMPIGWTPPKEEV